MNAALVLFSEKDFHEVTVEEIAERVGLSKGTMYLYFENKENLFLSIIQEKTDALLARIKRAIDGPDPYLKRLERLIGSWLGFFEEHQPYFKVIHSEKTRLDFTNKDSLHRHMLKSSIDFAKILNAFIEEGITLGLIRSLKPGVLVKSLQGLINSFIFECIFMRTKCSLVGETKQILDVFLNGALKKPQDEEVS